MLRYMTKANRTAQKCGPILYNVHQVSLKHKRIMTLPVWYVINTTPSNTCHDIFYAILSPLKT